MSHFLTISSYSHSLELYYISMKNQPLIDIFTTGDAAELSGLKPVMVDYLCREGVLKPSKRKKKDGRGKPRQYSFGDIVILKAIHQLLNHGISVAKLKKSLNALSKQYKNIQADEALKKYMVTDGKKIYFREKEDVLIDIYSGGQLAFLFVIDLDQFTSGINKDISSLSKKRNRAA